MRGDGHGGFRDRDLSTDLLALLGDCGGAMWLRDISDDMGESLGDVRRTCELLREDGELSIIKDNGADWYVKLNG